MVLVGWDVSHQEFTIEDHYYFSKLKTAIISEGGKVEEIHKLKDARKVDVLVINYPEKKFWPWEVRLLKKLMERGLRIIVLGYYKNEDKVANTVNSLTRRFGLVLNPDEVRDKESNFEGDEYLIVTGAVKRYSARVSKVMFPCSASVSIISSRAEPVVLAEKSAVSSSGVSGSDIILMAQVRVGEGVLVLGGSCSFWDNFSIDVLDNRKFALNILFGRE